MKTLVFVVALISLAGAQTVEKFGTGFHTTPISDQQLRYELYQKHNQAVDDITTLMGLTYGIDANRITRTTITADTVKGLAALRGNPNMDSCALSVVSGAIAASGRITVDSILGLSHFRGNPDIDSCVLTTVGGAVTLGRSFRRSATAADTITSISRLVNAGGADTVVITIGGVALKFVADVE